MLSCINGYGGFLGEARGCPRRGGLAMANEKSIPLLKLGDHVQIRHSGGLKGRIVELRGPLGPGGVQIYRVRYRREPKPAYIEGREDQLERITGDSKAPQNADN